MASLGGLSSAPARSNGRSLFKSLKDDSGGGGGEGNNELMSLLGGTSSANSSRSRRVNFDLDRNETSNIETGNPTEKAAAKSWRSALTDDDDDITNRSLSSFRARRAASNEGKDNIPILSSEDRPLQSRAGSTRNRNANEDQMQPNNHFEGEESRQHRGHLHQHQTDLAESPAYPSKSLAVDNSSYDTRRVVNSHVSAPTIAHNPVQISTQYQSGITVQSAQVTVDDTVRREMETTHEQKVRELKDKQRELEERHLREIRDLKDAHERALESLKREQTESRERYIALESQANQERERSREERVRLTRNLEAQGKELLNIVKSMQSKSDEHQQKIDSQLTQIQIMAEDQAEDGRRRGNDLIDTISETIDLALVKANDNIESILDRTEEMSSRIQERIRDICDEQVNALEQFSNSIEDSQQASREEARELKSAAKDASKTIDDLLRHSDEELGRLQDEYDKLSVFRAAFQKERQETAESLKDERHSLMEQLKNVQHEQEELRFEKGQFRDEVEAAKDDLTKQRGFLHIEKEKLEKSKEELAKRKQALEDRMATSALFLQTAEQREKNLIRMTEHNESEKKRLEKMSAELCAFNDAVSKKSEEADNLLLSAKRDISMTNAEKKKLLEEGQRIKEAMDRSEKEKMALAKERLAVLQERSTTAQQRVNIPMPHVQQSGSHQVPSYSGHGGTNILHQPSYVGPMPYSHSYNSSSKSSFSMSALDAARGGSTGFK